MHDDGTIEVGMDIRPEYLPYSFVEVSEWGNPIYPFQLDSTGQDGIYEIQNNWRKDDSRSSILFSAYPSIASNRIQHLHAKTERFQSHLAWDYDGDGMDEVAVSYRIDSDLWIEILDASQGSIYRRSLVRGEDRDGNGGWDGEGMIVGVLDVSGDGYPEIFVDVFSGYDLEPRGLYCLDWRKDSLVWEFDLSGNITEYSIEFVLPPSGEDTLIAFGVSAPENGVVAGDMDDSHTWLVCLGTDGQARWTIRTGRKFGTKKPVVVNTQDALTSGIFVPFQADDSSASAISQLLATDYTGRKRSTIPLPSIVKDLAALDRDGDGTTAVSAFLADNTLHIFSPSLREAARYRFNQPMEFVLQRDLLGLGQSQILLRAASQELWLFTQDFQPLARLETQGDVAVLKTGADRTILLVAQSDKTAGYVLHSNPWYQVIFFKYKNQILVLMGALAAGLATTLIFQRRTHVNLKLIQAQKTQLEKVHAELRAAQQQIIAQERFNQARDIAGGVAHEIHNSLCPAVNALDKLDSRLGLTEEDDLKRNRELLRMSEAAIARGMRMTDLVRVYSRLESEKGDATVDIAEVAAEVLSQNALRIQEMNVTVKRELAPGCLVSCNRDHAYSMINNLVINALDALSDTPSRQLTTRAHRENALVSIEVADSGPGIGSAIKDRVFDVFFTTKPSTGSGLGLAMVKKIAEMYAGSVTLKSGDKEGTKFIILLPASAVAQRD